MIRNIVFDMGMVLLRYEPLIACLRYAQGDREKALRLKAAIFDSPDWIKLDSGDPDRGRTCSAGTGPPGGRSRAGAGAEASV